VQILVDFHQAVGQFSEEHVGPGVLDTEGRQLAIRIAVAEVQRQNATWTASQLAWELRRSLHVLAPAADPETVLASLLREALAGQVPGADIVALAPAPDPTDISVLGVRASDGVSVYRPPGEGRYATADMLDTEEYLLSSARRRGWQAVSDDEADRAVSASDLGAEQLEVVRGLPDHHDRDDGSQPGRSVRDRRRREVRLRLDGAHRAQGRRPDHGDERGPGARP
jgi:hypothetical protein